MKLILTDAQAQMVIDALEAMTYEGAPMTDPENAKLLRLADRIRKLRGEEAQGYLSAADEKAFQEALRNAPQSEHDAIIEEFKKRFKQWATD